MALFEGISDAQVNVPTRSFCVALPQSDLEFRESRDRDFLAFNPRYKEEVALRIRRARDLGAVVIAREVAGQKNQPSHEILTEVIWLISASADFPRIDERLDNLQASLENPLTNAEKNNGIRSTAYQEWFFKVADVYSRPEGADTSMLDRINSPEKLTDYLVSVSVSDIPRTGIDNQREFNESLSTLMRMILREEPKGFPFHPELKSTLMTLLLGRFRNPATGYWGERYVRNGRTVFVDDISITFHVVSYLKGNVPDMDKVVRTTLAVQDVEFPVGCRVNGRLCDHLNMDVAELFRLGWPHVNKEQRCRIAAVLHELLQWCLSESLQPDGSFKMWDGDNSKEESTYYGAAFLVRVGYFDKAKRYWTGQDFPDAPRVRERIINYILAHQQSGGAAGEYYASALQELGYAGQ